MSPYEFEGTLIAAGETKEFGSNGFTKREFVLQESGDSKYPNLVPFVLKKERCSLLDNVKKGSTIKVGFYLNGRKWENQKDGTVRYFCDHDAVKIAVVDGENTFVPEPAEPTEEDVTDAGSDDDMPF